MIIVTGAAGFIGSALIDKLNRSNYTEILAVDHLGTTEKWKNLVGLKFKDYYEKDNFMQRIKIEDPFLKRARAIIHLGACSSTTVTDASYLIENNFAYTKQLAEFAVRHGIRFIYASSAATYGNEINFSDDHAQLESLKPLNMYGYSKQLFDLHAFGRGWLSRLAGVKFFNVYGPNEYHKGDMASVIFKAYPEIAAGRSFPLFSSTRSDYADGGQLRDFIYIKDAIAVLIFLIDHPEINGIYNVGSGETASFAELITTLHQVTGTPVKLKFIPMPSELAPRYQYFTQADISKLTAVGYDQPMTKIRDGITDYVNHYLSNGQLRLQEI